jgi:putative SOS response-associated peptidase YedK
MCGRYRLTAKERYLRDHFGLDEDPHWTPRWNIAPTQPVPVIRQDKKEPKRTFAPLVGGLFHIHIGPRMRPSDSRLLTQCRRLPQRNRRSVTAMRQRRCLIPADGFFEWKKLGPKEKQAYNIGMADDSVFAFAGLWERWRDPANEVVETFTILTTRPNPLLADVHNRMPVIIEYRRLRFVAGSQCDGQRSRCGLPKAIRCEVDEEVSSQFAGPFLLLSFNQLSGHVRKRLFRFLGLCNV